MSSEQNPTKQKIRNKSRLFGINNTMTAIITSWDVVQLSRYANVGFCGRSLESGVESDNSLGQWCVF